jgi:hypothetical protein
MLVFLPFIEPLAIYERGRGMNNYGGYENHLNDYDSESVLSWRRGNVAALRDMRSPIVRKKSFILILFGVLPVPQIRESLLRC